MINKTFGDWEAKGLPEPNVTLSFRLGSNTYEMGIPMGPYYRDEYVGSMITEVLAENGIDGGFYRIESNRWTPIVFLNSTQKDAVIKQGRFKFYEVVVPKPELYYD